MAKLADTYTAPLAIDLRSELALLRAVLTEAVERLPESKGLNGTDLQMIVNMCDSITRTTERIAKIMSATGLTQEEVRVLTEAIKEAVGEYIPDAETQRLFLGRVSDSIRHKIEVQR